MYAKQYDPTRESLYHPGNATDFFQYGPAQIQSEAALCAEMSRLAYVKEKNRLIEYLGRVKFEQIFTIGYFPDDTDTPKGTQLFIAKSTEDQPLGRPLIIVAFRGTEPDDPSDVFDDARFLLVDWFDADGRKMGQVHKGFADALLRNNILESILNKLNEKSAPQPPRILITGHSLGAALATLTGSRIVHTALDIDTHLYTFGSPRVGDNDFAKAVTQVDHNRYVDCSDIVTCVPPKEFGYVHVGLLRYIDRKGHILKSVDEDIITSDRVTGAAYYLVRYAPIPGTAWVREMADHSPINYVSGVTGLRS